MKLSNCSPHTLLSGWLLLLHPEALLGPRPVTLTFQEPGIPIGLNESIGNFYNGGGGPAVIYGITISHNAIAFYEGPEDWFMFVWSEFEIIVVDVPGGFTGNISFLYFTPEGFAGFAYVYDGLNGTGNLLRSEILPVTPQVTPLFVPRWTFYSTPFGGTAKSVVLDSYPCYDNLTFTLVGSSCPAAEIWDPTTNAIVGPLDNEGTYCLTSYNLRAVTCTETATLVDMRLINTATNAQIRRQKERIATYFLWGDDTHGEVFPNQKKKPNGPYRLRVAIDGVDTNYAFTQACS